MRPYAWLRRNKSQLGVGSCIADINNPIQLDKIGPISTPLHEQFSSWVTDFEVNSDNKNFPWEEWNMKGIELAKSLKKEVAGKFDVEYHIPCEDLSFEILNTQKKHVISI